MAWYAKLTVTNVGPDPARNEGSVLTRPMVERNVAKLDLAAQDVRHLIEDGVRKHWRAHQSRARHDVPREGRMGRSPCCASEPSLHAIA